MSRAVATYLPHVLVVCLRTVATRESPEALPYSKTLLRAAVIAALGLGVVNRILIPDATWTQALLNTVGEVGLLLLGLHLVLSTKALTLTRVASCLGCSVTTAATLARIHGHTFASRAKVITDDLRNEVLEYCAEGRTSREAAGRFDISISSINRIRREGRRENEST